MSMLYLVYTNNARTIKIIRVVLNIRRLFV